jgi:TetR/AcrR family transcriptional regulator
VRLFAVKGYAATTVRDILRTAGVTAPVLYYHFGNKEGLFLALVREGVEKVEAARLEAFEGTASAVERIRRYCLASVAVRREFADLAWVVEAILSGPPEAVPRFDFRDIVTTMLRQLQDLVEEGIARGELRSCDPMHAVMVLVGFMEVASRPRLFEIAGLKADELVEGMLSMVLDGLAVRTA